MCGDGLRMFEILSLLSRLRYCKVALRSEYGELADSGNFGSANFVDERYESHF